jgi:hypothetical protein
MANADILKTINRNEELNVLARVTSFKLKPNSRKEAEAIANNSIVPIVENLDGMISISVTYDDDTDSGVVTATYKDQQSMDAATESSKESFGLLGSLMAGPPDQVVHDVIMHVTGK